MHTYKVYVVLFIYFEEKEGGGSNALILPPARSNATPRTELKETPQSVS